MRGTVNRSDGAFEAVVGSEPHWPAGFVVSGKWKIERFLGAGGMGAVFEARHRNGKRVALKVLHRHLHSHPRFKAHFLREGYLANRVEHPAVVSVLDDGETSEGDVYLVMELLQGETLEARRKKGACSAVDSLRIADRILDVLAMAHAKGIVHRDIKPANVFLTSSGEVKLLDFGIASLREKAQFDEAATLPSLHALGTPSFMAPEQARGRKEHLDERADIWSLGAVLFTLLSGRYVHETRTAEEALISAATMPPRLLGSLRPDLPSLVTDVVDRALAFDPQERWENASAMQKAVRRAMRATHPEQGDDEPSHAVIISSIEQPTLNSGEESALAEVPFGNGGAHPDRRRKWVLLAATALAGIAAWGARWAATSSPPMVEPVARPAAPVTLLEETAHPVDSTALAPPEAKVPEQVAPEAAARSALAPPSLARPKEVRLPRKSTYVAPSTSSAGPATSTNSGLPKPRPTPLDDSWLDRQK